jgi:hypothetical protein
MFSSPPTSPFSNVSMLYVYQCIGGLVGRLVVPVTLLVGSLLTTYILRLWRISLMAKPDVCMPLHAP